MELFKQFDSYALQARIYPALLTLLPVVATVLAWYPALLTSNTGAAILTVINACGMLSLLSELSRSEGQRVQKVLLKDWAGWPTTRHLRHADNSLSADVKARYHSFLGRKLNAPFPTAAEEAADAVAADRRYASAVFWLKEQCRGPAFALILNENISYGFRRNLLGMKRAGIVVCLGTVSFALGHAWWRHPEPLSLKSWNTLKPLTYMEPVQVGALALGLIALAGWLFVVRRSWVKQSADLYAQRLLAACDSLP